MNGTIKLAPFRQDNWHHLTGETNGDSHLKSPLVHQQVIVPVTAGKLDFGPWRGRFIMRNSTDSAPNASLSK